MERYSQRTRIIGMRQLFCLALAMFCSCTLTFESTGETMKASKMSVVGDDLPYVITGYSHDTRLKEVSGMVKSLRFPGHFWVHNDSGDDPVIYRVNDSLQIVQEVVLEGAQNLDWEDVAICDYKGEFVLFIGDIGDNLALRNSVSIYLINEPESDMTTVEVNRKIELNYEDGARDAEMLLVDFSADEIVVVTKRDIPSRVYSFALGSKEEKGILSYVGNLKLPNDSHWEAKDLYRITGGDSSSNGAIVLKNYQGVFYYKSQFGRSIKDRLVNDIPVELQYKIELQGEAIALDRGGYWVTSECADDGKQHIPQPLYFYPEFLEIKELLIP